MVLLRRRRAPRLPPLSCTASGPPHLPVRGRRPGEAPILGRPAAGSGSVAGVDAAGSDHRAGALDALARRVDGIRLPPVALPGWSSFCAHEYTVLVAQLVADVW